MKRILIEKELICPFNYCRIVELNDATFNNTMSVNCENCQYVWERKIKIIDKIIHLNENSKEYKEYEMLHEVKIIC